MFKKILYYINKAGELNTSLFVLILLVISFLITLPFEAFLEDINFINKQTEWHIMRIIFACSISPILETLCFQLLPIQIASSYLKFDNKLYPILISATMFGVMHFQSLLYIICAFLVGIIFALGFIIYRDSKGIKMAVIAISIVHALRNIITTCIWYITEN